MVLNPLGGTFVALHLLDGTSVALFMVELISRFDARRWGLLEMREQSLCSSVSEYEIESLYNLTILWYTAYGKIILLHPAPIFANAGFSSEQEVRFLHVSRAQLESCRACADKMLIYDTPVLLFLSRHMKLGNEECPSPAQ